jgi:hypothetical protein
VRGCCGGVGHVSLVGVCRRVGCRVGRGAVIVGAGAKSGESDGEEETAGTVPNGAQVSVEDAEERVHPATCSWSGVGSDARAVEVV